MFELSPFAGIDTSSLLHPPKAIAAFMQKLTTGVYKTRSGNEQRKHPRFMIATIVEILPVGASQNAQSKPFRIVSHDVSAGGIRLRGAHPITTKLLALHMTSPDGEQMKVMMEVLRCQSSGNVYDIAGRFISSVDSQAESASGLSDNN
jgi:hypothetical protein